MEKKNLRNNNVEVIQGTIGKRQVIGVVCQKRDNNPKPLSGEKSWFNTFVCVSASATLKGLSRSCVYSLAGVSVSPCRNCLSLSV